VFVEFGAAFVLMKVLTATAGYSNAFFIKAANTILVFIAKNTVNVYRQFFFINNDVLNVLLLMFTIL
jgi:O-glycosyl hydrolase